MHSSSVSLEGIQDVASRIAELVSIHTRQPTRHGGGAISSGVLGASADWWDRAVGGLAQMPHDIEIFLDAGFSGQRLILR